MSDEAIMLKACPWCRKAVQHRFALDVSDGGTDDIIHAAPTDCGMQYFSVGSADRGVTVAAAWNQRTPDSTLQAHTDRLAEALRECNIILAALTNGKPVPSGFDIMAHYQRCVSAELASRQALAQFEGSAK